MLRLESAAAIIIRGFFGVFLGLFLGVLGFYVGWFVTPPGPGLPTSLLLNFGGTGAAAGAFIAWFKPEAPTTVNAVHLVLVLAGGVAGAWIGWTLGQVIYPEGVYNPAAPVKTPPFVVPALVATGASNVLGLGFYSFRMWQYREV